MLPAWADCVHLACASACNSSNFIFRKPPLFTAATSKPAVTVPRVARARLGSGNKIASRYCTTTHNSCAMSDSKWARDASMLISVAAGCMVGSETITMAYVVEVNPSINAEYRALRTCIVAN